MAKKKISAGDNPSWLEQCLKNIQLLGGKLCSDQHCADAAKQNQMICTCEPPYLNGCAGSNPPSNCCSYTASSPVFVAFPGGGCYCCCGSASQAAEVATTKSSGIPADQLKKGDSIYVPKDTSLREWTNVPVQFVSVSRTSADQVQAGITYRDAKGKQQQLIVGARQLMMMPDKKFREAGKLVPGFDRLVTNEGKAVEIESVRVKTYTPYNAYIASTVAPAAEPTGHLLSINGFVAGDYALSLGIGAEHLGDNHDRLPVAGTAEYIHRYPHLN